MSAQLKNDGVVVAYRPDCGGLSTFESRTEGRYYGRIERQGEFFGPAGPGQLKVYQFVRCAGCARGGLSTVLVGRGGSVLEAFSPRCVESAPLPSGAPEDIVAEVREAESCAAVGAWRAASAMLRSALEKTLKSNGYTKGDLKNKIDEAAADGVITASRQQRAHDEVRDLGNDVLHDKWRVVDEPEYDSSHLYTQRVIEDFYDSRPQVEEVLRKKGRIT